MTDLDTSAARAAYEAFGEGEYGFGDFDALPDEAKARWQKVAATVRTANSSGVKVLEWDERSGAHYADTAFGEACIDEDGDGFYVIESGRKHSDFASIDAAKAFVQKNHDAWVIDWLSPAEPGVDGDVPMLTPEEEAAIVDDINSGRWPYLQPLTQTVADDENALEDAAKAAFVKAQSVYRADHDHFPLKSTWETTDESIRDGWRAIAYCALEAAAMPPLGTQPEPRSPRATLPHFAPSVSVEGDVATWRAKLDAIKAGGENPTSQRALEELCEKILAALTHPPLLEECREVTAEAAIDRFEAAAFAKFANLPRSKAEREAEYERRSTEYDAARRALFTKLEAGR